MISMLPFREKSIPIHNIKHDFLFGFPSPPLVHHPPSEGGMFVCIESRYRDGSRGVIIWCNHVVKSTPGALPVF